MWSPRVCTYTFPVTLFKPVRKPGETHTQYSPATETGPLPGGLVREILISLTSTCGVSLKRQKSQLTSNSLTLKSYKRVLEGEAKSETARHFCVMLFIAEFCLCKVHSSSNSMPDIPHQKACKQHLFPWKWIIMKAIKKTCLKLRRHKRLFLT